MFLHYPAAQRKESLMKDLNELMRTLGCSFHNKSLLERALTHPSLGADNNQRLEFLGDAVLQIVISRRLYSDYQSFHEGQLTQMRQKLVCEGALAKAARAVGLGEYLRMDKGCEQTGGRNQDSVLADAMESVLAAVYLDSGLEAAAKIIDRYWPHTAAQTADAKSALQEYLQARGIAAPKYETLKEEGPAHERIFTVAAYVNGQDVAHGRDLSKKKAEQAAARSALESLKSRGGEASCG